MRPLLTRTSSQVPDLERRHPMKCKNALAICLRTAIGVLTISLLAVPASAQLTREQKVQDFQNLAALYAKRYAPYEWKKELFSFDLFEIGPWLDRIRRSQDDLEFFEIALEYVASLRDTALARSPCRPASWRIWVSRWTSTTEGS